MVDIKRPRTTRPQPQRPSTEATPPQPTPPLPTPPQDFADIDAQPSPTLTPKPKKQWWRWLLASLLLLGIAVGSLGFWWYQNQLAPVDASDDSRTFVSVVAGSTPTDIARQLREENLIRSEDAFLLYTRITRTQNSLQAGSYRLSPSQSTPQIVSALTSGQVETYQMTFIPGTTLQQQREVFLQAGFEESEVDSALSADYDFPFMRDKPARADLEGYLYPETYQVATGASAESVVRQALGQFQRVIDENDLEAGFAAQGLSIFEGIILASIIEKEAVGGDERQIAQVFLLRLEMGMPLGSDPTYQYIADKRGIPRDLNLNDPYNTRRFAGLTPGPIASPGLTALQSVTDPADGDFVYFLSGDDDVTYFSRTLEEHERNIREKCQIKCQFL